MSLPLVNESEPHFATPRTAHLVGWTAVAGPGSGEVMTERASRVLDAFVGDYGRLRVIGARQDFAYGFWKPQAPLPMTTWSTHSDPRFICFLEGVFYDDYEGHRIVEGEDPGLARALVEAIQVEGESAAGRLNGSFAGFVYDAEARELSTFVDRLGTRMLYWTRSQDGTTVSTSLAAFRGIAPPKLDLASAFQFLTVGFPIGERTLLEGVFVQPPASIRIFAAGSQRASRDWTPPAREEGLSLRDAVARITGTMEDSVARLARRAPERFGLGLTGGHDSRVIFSSLLHQRIPFEAMSWRDNNFNDRVMSELCARARVVPHIAPKASRLSLEEIRKAAFAYTDGQYFYAYGFTWLGLECSLEGLDAAMLGFGGDLLSGSAPVSWNVGVRTIGQLAHSVLAEQMELLSFRKAEALLGAGACGRRAETLSSWMATFEREAWRNSLLDISIWQRLQNRNFKRVRHVMNPALQYVQILYPYLDNSVLDAYFRLPFRFLDEKPHCYAGFYRFTRFGDLPATSFPITLRQEALFPFSVYLLRLGRAAMKPVRSRFHRAPAQSGWSADDEQTYARVAESPLFDSRRLEKLVATSRIKMATLRKMRTLVSFDRFYVRGEADSSEVISRDDREAPSGLRARRCRRHNGEPGRRKEGYDRGRDIDRLAARLNEGLLDPLIHRPRPERHVGQVAVLVSIVEVGAANGVENVFAGGVAGLRRRGGPDVAE